MLKPTTRTTAPTRRKAVPRATPAARMAMPSASTKGAAVGRGIWTDSRAIGPSVGGVIIGSLAIYAPKKGAFIFFVLVLSTRLHPGPAKKMTVPFFFFFF